MSLENATPSSSKTWLQSSQSWSPASGGVNLATSVQTPDSVWGATEGNKPQILSAERAMKDPQAAQADLIELQRLDYAQRFQPLEMKLMGMATSDGEGQAQQAGTTAARQSALSREQFMRDLGRSGTALTSRQAGAIDRNRGLSDARNVANAKNSTRKQVLDQNLEAQAGLIGIGRDVQQSANRDLGTASGMQSQRQQAGANAKAADKAQTSQMIGTGLGLVAAMFL